MNKLRHTIPNILLYLFFSGILLLNTQNTTAQWNPDAGYVPSLTIGKSAIPSSGTDAVNGIDGSTHNHWTSNPPLPQNYISRADQNGFLHQASTLCTTSGVGDITMITDGNLSGNTNVSVDGTGEAWITFNFPGGMDVLLTSIKMNVTSDVEVYYDQILTGTYTAAENYSTKRFDINMNVQSITFKSSSGFGVFEIAGLSDVPREYFAVDLGAQEEIGFIHTKHWAGNNAATAAALYVSPDNTNWTKVKDLNPTTLAMIQHEINPVVTARYIKVEYDVIPNDWNRVFLFELAAYDRHNKFGPAPNPSLGTRTLEEMLGINSIWGWGHNIYSDLLNPGEGPDLHNEYASHARNYHSMSWDVNDPDNAPDYNTMAAGGGTEAQWWLDWNREYNPWVNAGLEIETSIFIADFQGQWNTPFNSAYNYGYNFAEHFGPTTGSGLVRSMEIGNEPWFYNANTYLGILKGMAQGAKAADPSMLVFPCALQAHDPDAENSNSYFKNYMGARIRETDATYLDGINVHNYSYAILDDGGNGTRIGVHPEHYESGMHEIRNSIRFRNQNMPNKLIYVSEWGWDFAGPNSNCTHSECVTPDEAAYYAVRGAMHYMRMGVDRFTWFFYADDTGTNSSLYTRSGLSESIDHNFSKKRAFLAFEAMKNQLGNRYFVDVIQEDNNAYIYALGDNAGNVTHYVAWKPIDGNDITTENITFTSGALMPSAAYTIRGLDPSGTNEALPSYSNGNITATLSTVPLVIEVTDALPVELLDFTVTCGNNKAFLEWSTATEENNSHFEIQRKGSQADDEWRTIGTIEGHGNSSIVRHYTFLDPLPDAANFYRLKQVDFDGQFEYSRLVSTQDCSNHEWGIFPNPTLDYIQIKYKSEKESEVQLKLFDVRGSSIRNQTVQTQAGYNLMEMDLRDLPKGVYMLELHGNGQTLIEKVVLN